jgi:Tat protein translocase TatB subunit
MFNIGTPELLVILLVALIVVGPQRLPELGRTIGRGLREFRKVQDDVRDMVKLDFDDEPAKPAPKRPVPDRPVGRPPRSGVDPEPTEPSPNGDGPVDSTDDGEATATPADPATGPSDSLPDRSESSEPSPAATDELGNPGGAA